MAKPNGGEIEINLKIDENLAIPHLMDILSKYIVKGVDFIEKNFQSIIIDPLIFGGKGWKSFVDTSSWKWINSPKGLGQLGFTNPLEPLKLLNILRSSWKVHKIVTTNVTTGGITLIGFNFSLFNLEEIKKHTIHPAAGKLNLPSNRSWFEWIYAGIALKETGYHFRKTGPTRGSRSSSIAGGEAGLMKKGGLWQVSPRFRLDIDKLIEQNEDKITRTIQFYIQQVVAEQSRL